MKRFNLLQMLQSIGRSLMIPIAMLPAAGILLAFGVSFQDPNIVASLPFLGADWLVHVLKLMAEAGSAIFANLPLLFAVGVAVGLSDDQGIAGLSAIAGFLIMNVTIGQFLGITPESVAQVRDYTMALASLRSRPACLAASLSGLLPPGCINAITASSFRPGWSSSPASALCR